MELINSSNALAVSIDIRFRTCLMLRSGNTGEFSDSEIEMTPEKESVHISGYVWASLFRRVFSRIKGAEGIAREIGDYDASQQGISRFWADASFVKMVHSDIRPGIRIDRAYGSIEAGALFSDEVVSPGHCTSIDFIWFLKQGESESAVLRHLLSALHLIDSPVESIGGGWSYGFGRMEVLMLRTRLLDLKDSGQRKNLFKKDRSLPWDMEKSWDLIKSETCFPDLVTPFETIKVTANIADGQYLSVAVSHPGIHAPVSYAKLPDSFVFRGIRINGSHQPVPEFIIPGKALRQALFSAGIERRLRSKGRKESGVSDLMDRWFGSTNNRGLVAIADARVDNAKPVVINRIQLCEHTLQNLNLFSGEYLQNGNFTFTIVLDEKEVELGSHLIAILEEMQPQGSSPPGWYRLGMTSTATGQIAVTNIQTCNYPEE